MGKISDDVVESEAEITIEMVKCADDVKGFVVLAERWVGKYGLRSKEYERTLESSEADIFLAMASLMLRRSTMPVDDGKGARKFWWTPSMNGLGAHRA